MTDQSTIELGDIARDRLTGYQGCAVGVTEWLNGCRRFGLQSLELNKDGVPADPQWFDEPQCEMVVKARFADLTPLVSAFVARPTSRPGGPRADPVR